LEEPKNNKPTDEDYERQAIDLVKEKSHSLICCRSLRFCAMSIWTVSILSSILTSGIVEQARYFDRLLMRQLEPLSPAVRSMHCQVLMDFTLDLLCVFDQPATYEADTIGI
jgi:hypothetical protein